VSKIVSFLLLLFFFLGCEDKHFSKIYDTSIEGKRVDKLRISTADPELYKIVAKALKEQEIKIDNNAALTLEAESQKYAKHCNNPLTCSYDATYDGYMKIRLMRQMHPLYMIQQDYHGELNPEILASLIARMYDDLDLEK
jgi:hypothetical protein